MKPRSDAHPLLVSALRNLWMLSAYVPADRLQIEFLNNARNAQKYPENDDLAPANVPLEYTSALTLPAQPLAWMELSGLSHYGTLKTQLAAYQKVKSDFHRNTVLPVGGEPSGSSWTGFAVYGKDAPKYLMVFREKALENEMQLSLPLWPPGASLTPVFGGDISVETKTEGGRTALIFKGNVPFSHGLFIIE
ncbi:hypothetical protein [Maribacter sp. 2307ULW6-5]|uniref:hypothetical protein n=1 Tax=Maribacter sp. 2307ULW6-5 TaxID=3386275 RepID=UPI0039BC4FC0